MALKRVGVIADDLTGAADTTLAFWQHGFATFILLDGEDDMLRYNDAVVTIDTDSRHVSPQESAVRIMNAVYRLNSIGITTFYKKIDSTLRGNPGAEIEALMRASHKSHAIVCPAFPLMERTVVDGRVLVKGVDLMQTPAASDPRSPVISSRIAEILAQQTTLPIEELGHINTVTNTPATRCSSVEEHTGMYITVVDARTDEDLRKWVRYFGTSPEVLWVGAAGLAEAIADELGQENSFLEEQTTLQAAQMVEKPVLVVAGSIHVASREQITLLCTSSAVTPLSVDPVELIGGTLATGSVVHTMSQILEQGKHCVLYTECSSAVMDRLKRVLDELGYSYEDGSGMIAQKLSEIVFACLSAISQPVDLVLTGGDTAKPILALLGVSALRVVQMVAPGTPISETLDGVRQIVTKAGGFGQPDILVQAVNALIKRRKGTMTGIVKLDD